MKTPEIEGKNLRNWFVAAMNAKSIKTCVCDGRKITVRPKPLTDAERMKNYRRRAKLAKNAKAKKATKKKAPKKR